MMTGAGLCVTVTPWYCHAPTSAAGSGSSCYKCETCTKVKEEGERKGWTSKYILNGGVRTFDIAFVWNNEIKTLLFLTSLQLHLYPTQLWFGIVISQFQCSTWFLLLLINRSVPLAMACLHQFPVFLESKLIIYTWPRLSDNSSHPGSPVSSPQFPDDE